MSNNLINQISNSNQSDRRQLCYIVPIILSLLENIFVQNYNTKFNTLYCEVLQIKYSGKDRLILTMESFYVLTTNSCLISHFKLHGFFKKSLILKYNSYIT
jgi:hypothetical protein